MDRVFGVYRIRNLIDNKIYIGSTSCTGFKKRWKQHLYLLRINEHNNKHLQNAFNRDKEENFVFEGWLICDPENCLLYEQIYLDGYKSYLRENGYNLSPTAGSTKGIPCPEEKKKKISFSLLGEKNVCYGKPGYWAGKTRPDMIGEGNPMYGKPSSFRFKQHTDETKKIQRQRKEKIMKPIERIDLVTGEVKEYSCKEDVKYDDFNPGCVWMCCNKKRHYKNQFYKNFFWQYLLEEHRPKDFSEVNK